MQNSKKHSKCKLYRLFSSFAFQSAAFSVRTANLVFACFNGGCPAGSSDKWRSLSVPQDSRTYRGQVKRYSHTQLGPVFIPGRSQRRFDSSVPNQHVSGHNRGSSPESESRRGIIWSGREAGHQFPCKRMSRHKIRLPRHPIT